MEIAVAPVLTEEAPAVLHFLTTHDWPFHAVAHLAADVVQEQLDRGWLSDVGTQTFWLSTVDGRQGLLRLFDLDDGTPLFDLRIVSGSRGRGIGTAAVRWVTAHVFNDFASIQRVEATTRVDNVAMRRALTAAGWAKESHWRHAWVSAGGEHHDAVGYGVLREDFVCGEVTPVAWDA